LYFLTCSAGTFPSARSRTAWSSSWQIPRWPAGSCWELLRSDKKRQSCVGIRFRILGWKTYTQRLSGIHLSRTAPHKGSTSSYEESFSATSSKTFGNLIIPGYTRASGQSVASEAGNMLLRLRPTSSAASKVITETIIRTVPHDYTREPHVQARNVLSEVRSLFHTESIPTAPWRSKNSSHCGHRPTGIHATGVTGESLSEPTDSRRPKDTDTSLQSVASLAGARVLLVAIVACMLCLL